MDDVKMIEERRGEDKISPRISSIRFPRGKKRKKIRSMNLYPRLCSSFLRFDPRIIGAPYRRISLLISQVDVSRRSVIHIDPLSPSPRPRSQPAGPVSVGWIIIPAFRSALSTSLGAVLAPRTALCPFRAASATCREYFRCSPANLTPFARVLANFPCPALCPLHDFRIFVFSRPSLKVVCG